jgi:hypothetical protein
MGIVNSTSLNNTLSPNKFNLTFYSALAKHGVFQTCSKSILWDFDFRIIERLSKFCGCHHTTGKLLGYEFLPLTMSNVLDNVDQAPQLLFRASTRRLASKASFLIPPSQQLTLVQLCPSLFFLNLLVPTHNPNTIGCFITSTILTSTIGNKVGLIIFPICL